MTTILEFNAAFPGMNGKEGVMREHFTKRKKRLEALLWEIIQQEPGRHKGKVRITYTRQSPRLMDWFENLPATGKILMDAIVRAGVIKDDSPKYIPEQPKMFQRQGKAWTQIIIEDIE